MPLTTSGDALKASPPGINNWTITKLRYRWPISSLHQRQVLSLTASLRKAPSIQAPTKRNRTTGASFKLRHESQSKLVVQRHLALRNHLHPKRAKMASIVSRRAFSTASRRWAANPSTGEEALKAGSKRNPEVMVRDNYSVCPRRRPQLHRLGLDAGNAAMGVILGTRIERARGRREGIGRGTL